MFYVCRITMTDGTYAFDVRFRDHEIYLAINEADAEKVAKALNESLMLGWAFQDQFPAKEQSAAKRWDDSILPRSGNQMLVERLS